MKKSVLIALAAVVGTSAMAKIRIFSNEEALAHILVSRELLKVRIDDATLSGLVLNGASVIKKNNGGIGDVYTVGLRYAHEKTGRPALPTVCGVNARVETLKVESSGPMGSKFTTSELGAVQVSEPACAH